MTGRRPLTYLDATVAGRPYAWPRTASTKSGRRVNPAPYRAWKRHAADVLAGYARWRAFEPDAEISVDVRVHPDGVTVRATVLDTPIREALTGDLDNYGKAVLDALQAAGVIADDKAVSVLTLTFEPAKLHPDRLHK